MVLTVTGKQCRVGGSLGWLGDNVYWKSGASQSRDWLLRGGEEFGGGGFRAQ